MVGCVSPLTWGPKIDKGEIIRDGWVNEGTFICFLGRLGAGSLGLVGDVVAHVPVEVG